MRAIRVHQFGGPEVLKLDDVADPKVVEGQVLVRVHAIGVNPVETYVRAGKYGPRDFPFTPGSDASGVVETIGANVKKVKVGDRVYTSGSLTGTYAEMTLCKESQVHRLPDSIPFEQGAALGVPYATAYQALFNRGKARAGETVLIHGASGGVGTACVQMARAAGLTVIGTGGTENGRRLVREQGAHQVLDHSKPDYLSELMSLTGSLGADLIIEMLANVNLAKDLTVLAKFGRVVVVGSRGNIEITPRETMARDADIRGMTLFNATEDELRAIHRALIAGLENGTLRPIVGKAVPLAAAAKSHVEIIDGKAYGKIVLTP